jgi:hypothetical protein
MSQRQESNDSIPCKLCGQIKPLVNSHIIPEWCYKPLYDEKHRFVLMPLNQQSQNQFEQQGFREPLLCMDCDGRIGVWEKYVSEVFSGGVPITIAKEQNMIVLTDIDYPKYKLFLLSLLWRAGISTLPYFDSVNLGPHAEYLRLRLLAADPGKSWEYGCVPAILLTTKLKERTLNQLIMPPDRGYYWGYQGYRFVLGGVLWLFIVAKHSFSHPKKHLFAREDGTILFGLVDADEAAFMNSMARTIRLGKMQKAGL